MGYLSPRNPEGRNGCAGDRSKRPHSFRLPEDLDRVIRDHVSAEGCTLTQFWESLARDFVRRHRRDKRKRR